MQHQLVVRGGTVIDGTGGPPCTADVAVDHGVITAIGDVARPGREEIDARHCLVTPGFVDVHTHHDGQATWSSHLEPSSGHGVTTVVMGNCGVGFAPCRAEHREVLVRLMEGVEDLPGTALAEGLPWTWEHFGDYLEEVSASPRDVDVATFVPHGPLRVFVMGQRGVDREPATPSDIAAMSDLARQAVRQGALGLSTSRTMLHRTADGEATPMLGAAEAELMGIAGGVRAGGGGVFAMVSDFLDPVAEHAMMTRVAARAGYGGTYSLLQTLMQPQQWKQLLSLTRAANLTHAQTGGQAGARLRAQVLPRPVGVIMGLDTTVHPFMGHPTMRALAVDPLPARVRALRDPMVRARLLRERPMDLHPLLRAFGSRHELYFAMGDPPDYEPAPARSIKHLAGKRGVDPMEVALDAMLADGGRGLLFFPFANYVSGSLDDVRTMMAHPDAVFGLGDAGAHVSTICDGSATTTTLTHWGRDRAEGRFGLPWLVELLTRRNATLVGLHDRGTIAPGMRGDLNVIDFDRLRARRPTVRHDLPAGGRRLVQAAEGYVATVVRGVVTRREGEVTGLLPGRLVRGRARCPTPESGGHNAMVASANGRPVGGSGAGVHARVRPGVDGMR